MHNQNLEDYQRKHTYICYVVYITFGVHGEILPFRIGVVVLIHIGRLNVQLKHDNVFIGQPTPLKYQQ